MLVLSSHLNTDSDLDSFLSALIDLLEAGMRPVLRPAGLPLLFEEEPQTAAAIRRIAERVAEDGLEVWNGGWAGADGDILTPEEFSRELEWGLRSPWESGLATLLGVRPAAAAPLRMTDRQAQLFAGDVLVAGRRDTRAEGDAARSVQVFARGTLRSGSVRLLHVDARSPLTAERRAAALEAERAAGDALDTAGWLASLPDVPAPPPGFWQLGAHRAWLRPAALAAAVQLRAATSASRERNRRVLRAASGRTEQPASYHATANPAERELQGGVTGALSLEGEGIDARFNGGRLAALLRNGVRLTPELRAQGVARSETDLRFLETLSGAWFTGTRVRGVHETAVISEVLQLETAIFATDGVPGLTCSFTLQPDAAPASGWDLCAPLELALLERAAGAEAEGNGALDLAILEADGSSRRTQLPLTAADDPMTADPQLHMIPASAVTLNLPGGPLTLRVVHPGAPVSIAFVFGLRRVARGRRAALRLVWYPLGCGRLTPDAAGELPLIASGRDWQAFSLNYRIDAAAGTPPLRCEPQLAGEISGISVEVNR